MKQLSIGLCCLLIAACGGRNNSTGVQNNLPADSVAAIAKEAWIYGYPMFYNYRTMYLYAINKDYPDYAGGFNVFKNYGKSFDYNDTSVVTPNNDTPYSWAILDLSGGPVILEVPAIAGKRYYVLQLIDLYTFNYAYIGSRTTGNKAGRFLLAGPSYKGQKPSGIDSVIVSETNLVTVLGRTELYDAADIVNVKKIQEQYKLTPLQRSSGQQDSGTYSLPLPAWKESDYKSVAFISVLNALLQYCSVDPSEAGLRARFAGIGITPGKEFDSTTCPAATLTAIRQGILESEKELNQRISRTTSSLDLFGTQAELKNNYLIRATAAAMGLFGNTKEEAVYSGSMTDDSSQPLTGNNSYLLHFTKAQVPPVTYFWSITLYSLPARYLIKNPINRYSIGDRTKGLQRDPDGGLSIYLQATSPGKEKSGNWLPTPVHGPFNYVIRLYGPGPDVTSGHWQQPLPQKVK